MTNIAAIAPADTPDPGIDWDEIVRDLPNGAKIAQQGYTHGGFAKNRDSDALIRANFRSAAEFYGQSAREPARNGWRPPYFGSANDSHRLKVYVARFDHWACGWTEVLLIRKDWIEGVDIRRVLLAIEADFGVLSEQYHAEELIEDDPRNGII